MRFAFISPIAVLVLSACAGKSANTSACAPVPRDSVYRAATPAYRDCAVDREARLLNPNERINYQPSTQVRSPGVQCHTAEVEFVVDTAGKPEVRTARVLRANPPEFGDAVLAMVPRLSYRPAEKSGIAVRQIVQLRQGIAATLVVVRAGSTAPPPAARPPC